MKKNLLLSILVIINSVVIAQVPKLQLSVDTLAKNVSADIDGVVIDFNVINELSVPRFIVWERIVVSMTDGWESTICDPINCWAPSKSTSDFTLEAKASGSMIIDVYPNMLKGSAYIKMKFSEKNQPNIATYGRYRINALPVSTEEIEANKLRLFPNPTADYFVLEGNAPLTEVQVLSMEGRVLKTFPYIENDIYEIQDLNPGAYMLSLNGENGKRLATKRLMKL